MEVAYGRPFDSRNCMKGNTPMGELRYRAEELGIDTDNTTKSGTLRRKIAEVEANKAEEDRRARKPKKATAVRLHNHFKPYGWYEVVGHYDSEENFIADGPAPAPTPGVNFEHKLWAGTVVKLPEDEAKSLVEHVDMVTVTDRDPTTRLTTGRRQVKRRRALAEVYVEWTNSAVGLEDARA